MARALLFLAIALGGYQAQLIEHYVLKSVPVTLADGRAGLDLRPATSGPAACWKVIGLWDGKNRLVWADGGLVSQPPPTGAAPARPPPGAA